MPALLRRLKPYGLLLLLALPALWPAALAGIPRTNDGLAHLYRTVELDQLVRAGVLLPRWAPDLVLGFGYPVFNFFPYESHYLVEGLHLLGLSLLTAYNLAGALTLLLSGWFAYRLGRDHFGPTAGLVAGVAYLYSPYLLYDNYIRGSLPESLALALLPLALLYVRRAARGDRPAVAWAGLTLAAAILAHQGVMLQVMPFVGLYAIWEMVSRNWRPEGGSQKSEIGSQKVDNGPGRAKRWADFGRIVRAKYQQLLLPFVLALAISAFFWLPALTEARFAQTARGTGNGAMNYAGNFLSLDQLFALPRLPVDADLLNPPVVHSLPLAAAVLAGLAVIRWAWPRIRPEAAGEQGRSLLYLGGAAVAATLLIHPIAKPLWDAIPLLQLTLFPWRLLGPVSLFVALIAGALFVEEGRRTASRDERRIGKPFVLRLAKRSFVWLSVSLFLLITAGLPFASPPSEAAPANPGLAELAAFEVPPDFIGTTTVGEYLPIWVRQLPDTAADGQQLAHGERVARYTAPGADVQAGPAQPVGASFTVRATQPLIFVYRVFYFPGWQATLDGQPTPITITAPQGLMALSVPAGTHTIGFTFGTTLPRVAGDVLSLAGLAAMAAWLIAYQRARSADLTPPAPLPLTGRGEKTRNSVGSDQAVAGQSQLNFGKDIAMLAPMVPNGPWLFVFAVVLAAARPLLYDAGKTPLLRHGLANQPPALAAQPLDMSFQGEVHLWGADLPARPVAADDPVMVTLYWQAEHKLGVDYGFDLQLVDAAGHIWSQPGFTRPADWRFTPGTDFWPPNQFLLDPYVVRLLPGTPPGSYTAQVTVFARYNQQSLGTQPVGTVTVDRAARQAYFNVAPLASPAAGVDLHQAEFSPAGAAPGDEVNVSLSWAATAPPGVDLPAELRLVDGSGTVQGRQTFNLGGQYPASRWQMGDVLRDQVTVLLPATLTTGAYEWSVSVAGGPDAVVGQETVTAPLRSFSAPTVDKPLSASLGPITLWGVSGLPAQTAPGGDLQLTFQWLDQQTLAQSLRVFVHVQDAAGTLAAQSDGVPANWTRPTTGWLPGEYVADSRNLPLPADLAPGTYTIWAGLYRADTGERLTTAEFPDGQILVGQVAVGPP